MCNWYAVLPANYIVAERVCFQEIRTGFLRDLAVILPGLVLVVLGCVLVRLSAIQVVLSAVILGVGTFLYLNLHEILHGIVYKVMTGQKPAFGFGKGFAYCAMPDIYISGTVAILSTAAPLAVFCFFLSGLWVFFLCIKSWLILPTGLLLTFHLFGCRADINLLKALGKYKHTDLLMCDRGTEQWLYLPK